jgi:hypothetical protein
MADQLQLVLDQAGLRHARIQAALDKSNFRFEGTSKVLKLLCWHRGSSQAVRAEVIARQIGFGTGESGRRRVTRAIQELIEDHHIPIGGLREPPYGYYLIMDAQDLELAVGTLRAELRSLVRRLRVLLSREQVAELWGQEILNL